ncbi:MAG: DUF2961 domain-containing protein [Isosphaeraceae bacterium]
MSFAPLLLSLVSLVGPSQQAGAPSRSQASHGGFRPRGSAAELHDLGLLGRLRDPGVQTISFSSYDRKGGNNDGFAGTYSKLRVEGGDSVLAEVAGPGVIQRIWFTHTSGERPGLLEGKREHLRIYLDQEVVPVLDLPLEELFSGTHPRFPRPLVLEGSGGYVSYVPIPFRAGCKVVVEGQGVRFYQINICTLPPDAEILTFPREPDPDQLRELAKAAALWSAPEKHEVPGSGADLARYLVDGVANSEIRFALRTGPATVRCLEFQPAAGFEDAWRGARLRIAWDGEGHSPGVDVPIGAAFGRVDGAIALRSVLIGEAESFWYSRFPMPYHREAVLTIDSDKPIRGAVRVRSQVGLTPDAGYFRASLQQAPMLPGRDFAWLNEQGRGHLAGIFLMTRGKAKLPYWLEGDDRFRIDGRLAIHGTGSEDYFNCGWYALPGRLDRPACYPVHGFPVYRQLEENWEAAAYRWNLADPVPFRRAIEAGIEHGGDNRFPADYRAIVFWYSEQPGPSTAVPAKPGN